MPRHHGNRTHHHTRNPQVIVADPQQQAGGSRTLFTLQSCPVYVVGTLFVLLPIAAIVVVAFRRRNVIEADDEKASLVIV
jgi:hypothetical protein